MATEENKKNNPTMLGDPVSLEAETSDKKPTEGERGATGRNESEESQKNGKPKM
jgi:hypothetical protein